MLTKSTLLKFYKRRDIQEAMVQHAPRKEIGVRYGEAFGKRPDMLQYPREIIELALRNATSFHGSEELWINPLALQTNSSRKELDELRVGWDLVLDIDCKIIEYSMIAADIIIKFLKYCGVQDISIKFSGNKGFHIGVPFEAFPKQVGTIQTKHLFPEAPKKIALYVKENIKGELARRIMEFEQNDLGAVQQRVQGEDNLIRLEKNKFGEQVPKLNIDKFLEIDTVLLASRHLYRMPYSFHEKSGLVSVPLDPEQVMAFTKSRAHPENLIISSFIFLNREVSGESARQLLVQALDYEVKMSAGPESTRNQKTYEELVIQSPITEEFFPPCMQAMLRGMEDGKKRAVFCLMNFLGKIGWNKQDIEEFLNTWNKEKNRVPLREGYLKSQLHHFTPGERLPPNCDNEAYYKAMGIACVPGESCQRFKNPVNYTLSKWRKHLWMKAEQESRGRNKGKKEGKKEEKALIDKIVDTSPTISKPL